jgi:molecular chaperone DnaK (HSP70)
VAQAQSNPLNTIAMVKRYLGRSFNDAELKLEQQYNSVKVVNQHGKAAFEVEYDNKTIVLTPEQIAASMFNRLKRTAEKGIVC